VAFANPLLPQTPDAVVKTEEVLTAGPADEAGDRMPLAMEATEGISPELTTHKEGSIPGFGEELSPEEQSIQDSAAGSGEETTDEGRTDYADEDGDTAALAEGRAAPPAPARGEPA
jgi:hypothetical protein